MIRISALLAGGILLLTSCTSHFITDESLREKVAVDFASRETILEASGIDLESIEMSLSEKEALEFMYAYMPLGDIVNRQPSFYLDQYRMTRRALKEMPWGKVVPEREMRHFVLPVRVNNENIDSSRYVFLEELSPRVKNMTMREAVLEINHWCHEKAVYMPSDRRTSSPLATIRTAYGRCGEESTLLVAALRSVGIPARQVYTPRWAHTDSNHAWVEAWVDGEWCFLGACEPEPVLNLGWFNAPASRGLLMHTNVFGHYDGPEEIVRRTPNFTEINVIENYAPESANLRVKVVDADGTPVRGAKVFFQIYNYSEFNSVAYRYTDEHGVSSLTAGLGDMMVYASDKGRFGFSKVTFGKDQDIVLKLEHSEGDVIAHMEMEIVPPVENAQLPDVTDGQREENTCRMEYEDSLRNAYVATFFTRKEAEEYAEARGLDVNKAVKVLVGSRGNRSDITSFLDKAVAAGKGERALALLCSIAEKDLRDTPAHVLEDHLYNTSDCADVAKVLCPRVSTELLTSYRGYFQKNIPESLADSVRRNPSSFVNWCRDNLTQLDSISLRYVQLEPQRVWETRLADKESREIFFVAVCRSLGVSAWKDTVTGVVKYADAGLVYDVDFEAAEQEVSPKGRLKLRYTEIPMLDDPKYSVHFTLSKFDGDSFVLLNYGKSDTWSSLFRNPAEMDCGYYMLVSGSRMSGGNVFADVEFFTVEEGKTTEIELVMRDIKDQIRVIGSFDSEMKYAPVASGTSSPSTSSMSSPSTSSVSSPSTSSISSPVTSSVVEKSVLETTGRGYFAVILADYGTEPVNHAFMDISAAAAELEAWGRPILVVFATEDDCRKFRVQDFNLPSTVHYGVDVNGKMRKMIASEMKLDKGGRLPLVVLADTFNRVVFFSQGYNIGLGESLVKTSKAL